MRNIGGVHQANQILPSIRKFEWWSKDLSNIEKYATNIQLICIETVVFNCLRIFTRHYLIQCFGTWAGGTNRSGTLSRRYTRSISLRKWVSTEWWMLKKWNKSLNLQWCRPLYETEYHGAEITTNAKYSNLFLLQGFRRTAFDLQAQWWGWTPSSNANGVLMTTRHECVHPQ